MRTRAGRALTHSATPAAAAVIVGALTAYQSRVNGALAEATGNGLQAAVVSFGSGWLLLCIVLLASPVMRRGLRGVASALRSGGLAWWQVLGGLLGGTFVAVQSAVVPVVGVAVFTVAVVAGQSSNSLIVDRAGLGPAGRQPITAARVASALLAIVAVAVAVSDRVSEVSWVAVGPVLAAFLAGVGIAVQQAINGRVGATARSSTAAAWVNFTVGFAGLGLALGLAWSLLDRPIGPFPEGPWVLYTGGVIGVAFIATAAWVVQRLGVLLFALLSIAGQLSGAVILDLVAPVPGTTVHWQLLAGVVLAGVAVAVGSAPQWSRSLRRHGLGSSP